MRWIPLLLAVLAAAAFGVLAAFAWVRVENLERRLVEVEKRTQTLETQLEEALQKPEVQEPPGAPPVVDTNEIFVVGKQWMWKFQHPSGFREIGEVHVPAGKPFKLTLISEDVVHGFHIPGLNVRTDVHPGRYTSIRAIPEKEGRYAFHCDHDCGVEHKNHVGTIIVLPPDTFERWCDAKGVQPPADMNMAVAGREVFLKNQCNTCHSGTADAKAPKLDGLHGQEVRLRSGVKVGIDDAYLRESIRNPDAKVVDGWQPIMPPFGADRISEEDLVRLVAYLKSRKITDAAAVNERFGRIGEPVREPEQPRLEGLKGKE
jgi:cytochrome c oxidase subunit 2